MLWLALYLPRLPLEVFPGLPSPSAVVSRERVVVADDAAASAGVMPGLRLAEAWAFLPALAVQERDVEREQAALTRLACWAGGFTSEICVLPPQTLLLEVAGSLRLFGGAARLFERIVAGCAEQGFAPQAALAPTPLAAQWLAFAGDHEPCLDAEQLPQRLGRLPLAVLDLSAQNQARLASFGARRSLTCCALPRAGLARRLGGRFCR
jgi:protein ImuB